MIELLIVFATLAAAALLYRRHISKNWVDYRSVQNDMTDKAVVITGGNADLGYEAAADFAQRNATVVIACRDVEKGKDAVAKIREVTQNGYIECIPVDLASLDSIRGFVKSIKSKYSSIDALVCNAGVWMPPDDFVIDPRRHITVDGFEIHFGVNHLSHFLLANFMVELLEKSGDGRIVFVSSSLMKSGKIDFYEYDHVNKGRAEHESESKNSFAPPSYCDSKLMNALTCKHLSTLLPPTVTTYAVCPGFCRSELGRHVSYSFPLKLVVTPLMMMVQRTAQQGAQNIIFATLEDKGKLKSGEFYKDGEIAKEETDYADSLGDEARKLWEISVKAGSRTWW